jgi:hypothetical protein
MASGGSIEVCDSTSERLAEERANDAMQALIEPISRRIIESHGGHLWASANVEGGDFLLHVALVMIAVRPGFTWQARGCSSLK